MFAAAPMAPSQARGGEASGNLLGDETLPAAEAMGKKRANHQLEKIARGHPNYLPAKASIGSRSAALRAGIKPNRIPETSAQRGAENNDHIGGRNVISAGT